MDTTLFQYCQKLVIFDATFENVLLCRRKGENDFDGFFTFPGGKLETVDGGFLAGIAREKSEEIGADCRIRVYGTFTHNAMIVKGNGMHMVLPHYLSVYEGGEIRLNEEYSEYRWVPIRELSSFGPVPDTVVPVVGLFLKWKDTFMGDGGFLNTL